MISIFIIVIKTYSDSIMSFNLPAFDNSALEAVCHRFHVSKLDLFGSYARGEASAESDVDLLVEFEDGYTPSFLAVDGFAALHQALEVVFNSRVDLLTYASVEPDTIEATKELYAA